MTAQYIGNYSVGVAIPVLLAASAQLALDFGTLSASISLMLPELEAKLKAALELQLSLGIKPPSITAGLEVALALVASLEASIAISPPDVSASLAIDGVLALIAELQGLVLQLNAQLGLGQVGLDLSIEIGKLAAAAGIHLVTGVQETRENIGPAIGEALAASGIAPGTPVRGWLILTEEANVAAVEALSKLLKSA